MWKLRKEFRKGSDELRMVFVNTLKELMKDNKNIVALDADLGTASKFLKIKEDYPEQFIDMGIAEANMVGVAAGMSLRGYIPFLHSFAPFVSRRVGDQIFMAGAYSQNTLNIYGSDPGICATHNGGTHTSFEDAGFYRAIPGSMVFEPADSVQLSWLIRKLASLKGVHYIRASRKQVPDIYEEGSEFVIGKGNILREGKDILIITCGLLIADAMEAATELEKGGMSIEVIDMFTLKPLDTETLKREIEGKKMVVTFENHNVFNGLGSAVAEVMADDGIGVPLKRIGINDQVGQVGSLEYLKREYGLTKDNLIRTILDAYKKDRN
jgi:transketolase